MQSLYVLQNTANSTRGNGRVASLSRLPESFHTRLTAKGESGMNQEQICPVCVRVRETSGGIWRDWRNILAGEDTSQKEIKVCETCARAAREHRTRCARPQPAAA